MEGRRTRYLVVERRRTEGPDAAHSIVKDHLLSRDGVTRSQSDILISNTIPETNGSIFRTGDDEWEFGVEAETGDVVCVALEGLDACFGLIVPHFAGLLIICFS